MKNSIEETQSFFCKRNMNYASEEYVLPFVNNVLLMPSPLIKINTNCVDEANDLQKLLQLTPAESKFKTYNQKILHIAIFH